VLLEDVPLRKRLQMLYQHDEVSLHFTSYIEQCLDGRLPDRWIGHGGPQNLPQLSSDHSPLGVHRWGYMKNVVCKRKVDTRDEILQRIFDAANVLITPQLFVRLQFP
jgi:hypothetical protein